MKLLWTGKGGNSGSWIVRGEQLGAAIGATVLPNATEKAIREADLTVVVKRTPEVVLRALRAPKARWVYDAIDCYPQPQSSAWTKGEAVRWMQYKLKDLNPTGIIWPNHRMRQDCDLDIPGLVLPHHHRPNIRNNPIREKVKTVGYEGGGQYLAEWRPALEAECKRRGWQFIVNPKELAELDIVVAFRGGEWNGYVTQCWKSGIKIANAHASGTPFVGAPEMGYLENATGAEYWAETPSQLPTCFDWLEDQSAREQIHDRFQQAAYPVEKAAAELKDWLRGL